MDSRVCELVQLYACALQSEVGSDFPLVDFCTGDWQLCGRLLRCRSGMACDLVGHMSSCVFVNWLSVLLSQRVGCRGALPSSLQLWDVWEPPGLMFR